MGKLKPIRMDMALCRCVQRRPDGTLVSWMLKNAYIFDAHKHTREEFEGYSLGNPSPAIELRAIINIIRILLRKDRRHSRRCRFVEIVGPNGRLHLLTDVINRNLNNGRFTGKRLITTYAALREQVYDWGCIIIDRRPTTRAVRTPALRLC